VKLSEDIQQLDEKAVKFIHTTMFFLLTLTTIAASVYCQVYEINLDSVIDSAELTLTYLILFTGTRSDVNVPVFSSFSEFTAQVVLVVEIRGDRITYSIASSTYDNLPQISLIDSNTFLKMLVDAWLSRVSIIALMQAKPEIKHYVSVNGETVEAWVYKTENGLEYRDPHTGVFLGGILLFTISISAEQNLFGALRTINYTYYVESVSYLTSIKPFSIVHEMNVVKVDKQLIVYPLLAVIFLTVFASIRTYTKRKEYVIV